jgi:hypothetical protein
VEGGGFLCEESFARIEKSELVHFYVPSIMKKKLQKIFIQNP